MPNGKRGDHPFSDILHYGSSEFGEPVDGLVKKLAEFPRFPEVREEVAKLLWENSPMGREPERAELVGRVVEQLSRYQERITG